MSNGKKIFTAIALYLTAVCIIALAMPGISAAEDFEGENKLLKKLSQEELVAYFGLRYSLNDHQKRQYLSIPSAAGRREWMERYWIEADPTPASELNERRIEHEERVKLARKLFGMKKPPGWDRRGEVLIRFGMPAIRRKVPADIGFYRMIPPGEMWYYQALDMLVAFQNFSLSGEFIFAFEVYGMTGREQQDKLKAIAEFLSNTPQEELQVVPAHEIAAIANFNPDNIDYIADPNVRAEMGRDLIAAIESEKREKSKNNFQKYMKENPVIYSFELNEDRLPLFFDVTTFSGGEGAIRTEVNFEIPTSDLEFLRSGDTLRSNVRIELVVRDIESKEVARKSDIVRASQTGGQVWQGPGYIPGQLAVALEPGYYRIGIEATDTGSGKKGVFRTNIELASMDNMLAMSDVLFASTIRETSGLVKFQKGNLQVVPHPLHAYKIPYPLTFYFEIYGLDTDREGLAFYSVDYRIIPVSKRRKGPVLEEPPPAIDSSFETTGFGSTQVQRLEISTVNLWEGTFQLIVSIMDRRTRETVEKRANFSVLE